MRRCAGFDADQTRRQRRGKRQHLTSTDLPSHHDAAGRINAVKLKYVLRQIESDDRYPSMIPLLYVTSLQTTT